jgi:hypothetical protein
MALDERQEHWRENGRWGGKEPDKPRGDLRTIRDELRIAG